MDFVDSLSFWEIFLRLIKYLSIAATAYFAWYGAAHETRDANKNPTKAGKVVVRGVLVSLFIGLLSQVAEDKQKQHEAKQESIKQDSARKAFEQQRRVDDENRSEQMDRLEAILGKSNVTLDRLGKQDTLQRRMINDILDVNQQMNYSSNQLATLTDHQLQLLSQADAQLYPISPATLTIEYKHPIMTTGIPKRRQSLVPWQIIDQIDNTIEIQNDAIRSQIIRDHPEFWALKFFKKLRNGGWASKAGLVYFIDANKKNDVVPTVEGLPDSPYIKYKKSIANPERLIFRPNDKYPNLADRQFVFDIEELRKFFSTEMLVNFDGRIRTLDSLVKADVINLTGPPTIYSIKDLIESRFVVESVISHPGTQIESVTLHFPNNKSISLRGVSTNTTLEKKSSFLYDHDRGKFIDANSIPAAGDSYSLNKIVLTGIISPTKIGLFPD